MNVPSCQHQFDRLGGRCLRCGCTQRDLAVGILDEAPTPQEISKRASAVLAQIRKDTVMHYRNGREAKNGDKIVQIGGLPTRSEHFYVARHGEDYAVDGYQTGMGNTIGRTKDVLAARRFASPAGIMSWMGGHYKAYEPVLVELTQTFTTKAVEYPSESHFID